MHCYLFVSALLSPCTGQGGHHLCPSEALQLPVLKLCTYHSYSRLPSLQPLVTLVISPFTALVRNNGGIICNILKVGTTTLSDNN